MTSPFYSTHADLLFLRNPEDILPPTVPPSHSRQPSQPPSGNVSPIQTEHPLSQSNATETFTSIGEAVYPVDSITSNGTNEAQPSPSRSRIPPTSHPGHSNPHGYTPYQPPPPRPRGATRNMSRGGGVQMVLEETGSWTNLADHSATISDSNSAKSKSGSNSGMFSFLRKKGRERSPKPTEPGVLGKEGARQIIS